MVKFSDELQSLPSRDGVHPIRFDELGFSLFSWVSDGQISTEFLINPTKAGFWLACERHGLNPKKVIDSFEDQTPYGLVIDVDIAKSSDLGNFK